MDLVKKQEEAVIDNEFCNVYINSVIVKECHARITGLITTPDNYIELFKLLNRIDEDDNMTVHINSPGGDMDTAIEIMTAIKICKAPVTTEISGVAHSCAGLIFLSGHKYRLHSFSSMMCHYYTGFLYGKGHEIKTQSEFDDKFCRNFFNKSYKGFLTQKEINELINGKDFYFASDEIERRLNLRTK